MSTRTDAPEIIWSALNFRYTDCMIVLSLVCALITVALIAIVSVWQLRARSADPLDHAKSLYSVFVADVERREAAGQVDAELANEERVEAARALLKAEAIAAPVSVVRPRLAAILTLGAAVVTFGLYIFVLGHPFLPDQPYKQRLQQWTHSAQQNPDSLSPEALAAVLRQGAVKNGKDPQFWLFLGRIDMLAGHYYDGAKDYEQAQRLAPQEFPAWSELGEALTLVAGGAITTDAQAAFDKALTVDAHDTRALFYLGKMNLDAGRYELARGQFQTAMDALPAGDMRRAALTEQVQAVDVAQKAEAATHARIAGMVATLAAQLKQNPDNPDGWARLLRSYDVLKDSAAKARAVADMQAAYRDRPEVSESILARSQAAVGGENTGAE